MVQGRLTDVKRAYDCGFDFHKEGDRALHIAVKNKHIKIENYLKSIGLKYNPVYIENLWFLELSKVKSLDPLAAMYTLDKHQPLDVKNFQVELSHYMTAIGQDPNELSDRWGRIYIYKGSQPHKQTRLSQYVFCTFGRDGKLGGVAYNQDICTDTSAKEFKALLDGM